MKYNIALVKGDGIGPEIVDSAVRVLDVIAEKYGHEFEYKSYLAGGAAIDATGMPLPDETVEGCLASDSVLFGAVGGPKWDGLGGEQRPEKALLKLRQSLGLFTNLRPAKLYGALKDDSPLRTDIVERGFDIMIVRELTGGIYFGERGYREGQYGREAYDTEAYSVMEIEDDGVDAVGARAVGMAEEDGPDAGLLGDAVARLAHEVGTKRDEREPRALRLELAPLGGRQLLLLPGLPALVQPVDRQRLLVGVDGDLVEVVRDVRRVRAARELVRHRLLLLGDRAPVVARRGEFLRLLAELGDDADLLLNPR